MKMVWDEGMRRYEGRCTSFYVIRRMGRERKRMMREKRDTFRIT